MKHLFFDAETMGQNAMDCAVIDFSAVIVSTEKMMSDEPYRLDSIDEVQRFKLSIQDQVDNYGFVVYDDTIKFWQGVSKEARQNIKPLKTDLTVEEFTVRFLQFLTKAGKIDYWWSRSNTFDPVILWRLFNVRNKYQHMNAHLHYGRVRDIRTYIDAKLDFPKKNGFVPIDEHIWSKKFVEHDSRWDVLADVLRMQRIVRAETDLEMVQQ